MTATKPVIRSGICGSIVPAPPACTDEWTGELRLKPDDVPVGDHAAGYPAGWTVCVSDYLE